MNITAQEVLSFLDKANRLAINYTIEQVDDIGYHIKMYYNWNGTEKFSFRYVFIPNEKETDYVEDKHIFDDINDLLDVRLNEKYKKEEKERKRKALLERLTAEERELLGV